MCTTLTLKDNRDLLLAQNYDFYYGHGLVITNPRGVEKVALGDDERLSARWVARYGSVTFNQFARELPVCGMNETGLTIGSMWHAVDAPPAPAGSELINELQWIQFQLDQCASVRDVIQRLDDVRLSVAKYPMHYLVSDPSGDAAIVEHDGEGFVAYESPNALACSNAPFLETLDYFGRLEHLRSEQVRIWQPILDRAAKAMLLSREFRDRDSGLPAVDYAFGALDQVRLQVGMRDLFNWLGKGLPPSQTFWQIVFDGTRKIIYFRSPGRKNLRWINLPELDLSPGAAAAVLDVQTPQTGDVTDLFETYTRAANERIVTLSFKPIQDQFPPSEQEALIRYPELLGVLSREEMKE